MYLQIELTDKIIEAIKSGEAKTLSCKISVKPKKCRKKKEDFLPSKDVMEVIAHWNSHPKREVLEGDRNLRCENFKQASIIQASIDKLNKEEVFSLIDLYQEQCSSKGYLKHDRNLACKTLGSFCTTLLKNTTKWWLNGKHIKDNDPDLTEWIADSFASKFLCRKNYGLVVGTPAHEKFYNSQKVLDKIQKLGYNEEDSLRHLLKCIGNQYSGKTISPGMLCSEYTIKILLPQYFKNIGK